MNKIRATLVAAAMAMGVPAITYEGYEAIKAHEGLRLHAYPDPYYGWRTPTICYGHTKGVKRGDVVTLEQCQTWLVEDIVRHCAVVDAYTKPRQYKLTQGEYDAYCSFTYNTGYFAKTTSVAGRLGDDRWYACMGLLKYYYSDGKPSRGLWERRYKEYNTCISTLEYRASRS